MSAFSCLAGYEVLIIVIPANVIINILILGIDQFIDEERIEVV